MQLSTKRFTTLLPALLALATAGCGGDDPAPRGKINVRVAHLSPDAPAVDVCLKQGAGAFTGPVLKGLGVTAGVAYPQVTKYLELDAGQYTARLVAPNAADCGSSLAGLPDYALPSLGAGAYATAAAIGLVGGSGASGFTVKPFVDEPTVPAAKAALRFVHASPGTPAVDIGVGSGASFAPLFRDVVFGDVGAGAGVDANGFLVLDPVSSATVSARASGTTVDALSLPGVTLPAGAVASVFAIGQLTSTTRPLGALVCVDNAPPAGPLSACTAAP